MNERLTANKAQETQLTEAEIETAAKNFKEDLKDFLKTNPQFMESSSDILFSPFSSGKHRSNATEFDLDKKSGKGKYHFQLAGSVKTIVITELDEEGEDLEEIVISFSQAHQKTGVIYMKKGKEDEEGVEMINTALALENTQRFIGKFKQELK